MLGAAYKTEPAAYFKQAHPYHKSMEVWHVKHVKAFQYFSYAQTSKGCSEQVDVWKMATLLVSMTEQCIPCKNFPSAVGCAKSHLLCTDIDRKAKQFTVRQATKSICLTSRIAVICWDTTKFEPAHEIRFWLWLCSNSKKVPPH